MVNLCTKFALSNFIGCEHMKDVQNVENGVVKNQYHSRSRQQKLFVYLVPFFRIYRDVEE